MANTTNLSLGKLAGTENLKNFPTVQADNMDKIDQAVGAGFGSTRNVGGVTDALADAIAILANGNTHAAITSGQYVYVKNHASLTEGLYVATSNIAANATLSGSNLTADSSGGLNAALAGAKSYTDGLIGTVPSGNTVEGQITSLSNQIANLPTMYTLARSGATTHELTVPTGSKHYVTIMGSNDQAYWCGFIYCFSNGNTTVNEVAKGTDISTATGGTNKFTLTLTASRGLNIAVTTLNGSRIS